MSTIYTQKQSSIQKKDAPTAASVLDASSQSEALQRKVDMTNGAVQFARGNNKTKPNGPARIYGYEWKYEDLDFKTDSLTSEEETIIRNRIAAANDLDGSVSTYNLHIGVKGTITMDLQGGRFQGGSGTRSNYRLVFSKSMHKMYICTHDRPTPLKKM